MTSPLSPEAVAQMVADLDLFSRCGDVGMMDRDMAIDAKATLTTLAAENATLRAERDAAQSELDDCIASDWPIWATQIYNTLKEFGYRYDHFDGIDLPEDVSEFLRGFPENAASELMEQRDDALQELATLRASEAAALERVTRLESDNERLRYVIGGCKSAIDTGRNEPLRIWRDQIEIALTPTADKE